MKYDRHKIPYRPHWYRIFSPAKRFAIAVQKKDWDWAVALAVCGALSPDMRIKPLERTDNHSPYTDSGQSLLHAVVRYRRPDLVHVLLDHGANVNVCTYFQETPLYWAALDANLDMMVALLDRGANMSITPLVRGNYSEWFTQNIQAYSVLEAYNRSASAALSKEELEALVQRRQIHACVTSPLVQARRRKI